MAVDLAVVIERRKIAKVKNKNYEHSKIRIEQHFFCTFGLTLLEMWSTSSICAQCLSWDPLVSSAISAEMGTHLQPVAY